MSPLLGLFMFSNVFYNNVTPSGLTRFLKSMTLPRWGNDFAKDARLLLSLDVDCSTAEFRLGTKRVTKTKRLLLRLAGVQFPRNRAPVRLAGRAKKSNKISVYPQPFLFSPYLMKYLFILLLALPIAAQAQLEAGADYGLNFYRLTNRVSSSSASYNYNSQGGAPFTETAGRGSTLSLSYRFHKKLLAGIGYDRYVLPLSTPF